MGYCNPLLLGSKSKILKAYPQYLKELQHLLDFIIYCVNRIDPRLLSNVIVLLEALKRILYPDGFAGRSEQSAPGTAGLTGPYPHTGGDANHEGQEEPEKGNFETGGSVHRARGAILCRAAVQCGQQRQFLPSRPHGGLVQYANKAAQRRQCVQKREDTQPRHQAL